MEISEQELQKVVRAAIARHLQRPSEAAAVPSGGARHASHVLLRVAPGSDSDGLCLIEPAVVCNRCGYCQSYGH